MSIFGLLIQWFLHPNLETFWWSTDGTCSTARRSGFLASLSQLSDVGWLFPLLPGVSSCSLLSGASMVVLQGKRDGGAVGLLSSGKGYCRLVRPS